MGRVRRPEERVQNQDGNSSKSANRFFGQLFRIRDVAEPTNAVAVNRSGTVRYGNRCYIVASDAECFARFNRVSLTLRLAGSRKRFDRIIEDVLEAFSESPHGLRRSVHVDRRLGAIRQCAGVIDAMNMIGMIVSEQDRANVTDTRRDELKAQFGWGVDEDVCSVVRLHKCAYSGPFISRIGRPAHLASTANLGDTKAGSRPQKGEFQTVSTLSKLVVPGMSNGTPAVTMMRSPFDASSLLTTADFARPII
jgi:hypothetical protein